MISTLLSNFYKDFAASSAEKVIENGALEEIYLLATGKTPENISKTECEKLIFRAAYILEYIYFNFSSYFAPYKNRFYDDFPKAQNGSAKRHFTKIMRSILETDIPNKQICNNIAEACAEWIIEPKIKIAVQIGAIEILRLLKNEVSWIEEIMPTILEPIKRTPSPAIIVRLRKWGK